MINHVRTLLLNNARAGNSLQSLGEEYIPADYVPHKLDAALRYAHMLLYGTNTQRAYRNLVAQQLLELVHRSELSELITYHDNRISYLPWMQILPQQGVRLLSGNPALRLSLVGTWQPPPGTVTAAWQLVHTLDHTAPDEKTQVQYAIEVYSVGAPATLLTSYAEELASSESYQVLPINTVQYEIPRTGFKFSIYAPPPLVATTTTWRIDVRQPPVVDIAAKLAQLLYRSGSYLQLFIDERGTPLQQELSRIYASTQSDLTKYACILLGITEHTSRQPKE